MEFFIIWRFPFPDKVAACGQGQHGSVWQQVAACNQGQQGQIWQKRVQFLAWDSGWKQEVLHQTSIWASQASPQTTLFSWISIHQWHKGNHSDECHQEQSCYYRRCWYCWKDLWTRRRPLPWKERRLTVHQSSSLKTILKFQESWLPPNILSPYALMAWKSMTFHCWLWFPRIWCIEPCNTSNVP